MSDEREMVYRVMRASPDVRRGAAQSLGLLVERDALVGHALDKAVIQRALANGQLADLTRTIYG